MLQSGKIYPARPFASPFWISVCDFRYSSVLFSFMSFPNFLTYIHRLGIFHVVGIFWSWCGTGPVKYFQSIWKYECWSSFSLSNLILEYFTNLDLRRFTDMKMNSDSASNWNVHFWANCDTSAGTRQKILWRFRSPGAFPVLEPRSVLTIVPCNDSEECVKNMFSSSFLLRGVIWRFQGFYQRQYKSGFWSHLSRSPHCPTRLIGGSNAIPSIAIELRAKHISWLENISLHFSLSITLRLLIRASSLLDVTGGLSWAHSVFDADVLEFSWFEAPSATGVGTCLDQRSCSQ